MTTSQRIRLAGTDDRRACTGLLVETGRGDGHLWWCPRCRLVYIDPERHGRSVPASA